jgi:hypothetical protein
MVSSFYDLVFTSQGDIQHKGPPNGFNFRLLVNNMYAPLLFPISV